MLHPIMSKKNHSHNDNHVGQDTDLLFALFDHATEGIMIVDESAHIVMINPSAEKMFGYSPNELIGKDFSVLIPEDLRKKHAQHHLSYFKSPSSRPMGGGLVLYGQRKDNSLFPVEISINSFLQGEARYGIAFIIDITSRKKQEAELSATTTTLKETTEALSKLNSELEHKVQERTEELGVAIRNLAESKLKVMEALEREKELNVLKSRFVTTASHEFRTPLGTILSSASLLARYNTEEDADKRIRHIDRIRSAVNNLTEILNDFLSLDKLEEGYIRNTPVEFELNHLIEKTTDEMRAILLRNQTISVKTFATEIKLYQDRQIIRNILINLISNAIKYSPEGKPIEISITTENKGFITLAIKDEGIGIPDEDQHHLFEQFFRANNAGNVQGTGLGLNIVKRYVELLEGHIRFESKLNNGTTFFITLPVKARSQLKKQ